MKTNKRYTQVLALLPIIMCYKIPIINLGLSTVLIAVLMLPASIVIFSNEHKYTKEKKPLIFFFLFILYVISKSSSINILLQTSVIVHLLAIAKGIIDVETLKRYLINISCVACGIVLIQSICHYTAGFHIPCIFYPAILDSMKEQYFSGIMTGIGRWGGMYRPSAFFLEPAHMAQYCFIGLILTLLNDNISIKISLFISAGILATASGIGILCTFLSWMFWIIDKKFDGRVFVKIFNVIKYSTLLAISYFVLIQIPFFQKAISRFTVKEEGEYNAVEGRLFFWDQFIGSANERQLVWGLGYDELPEAFFTGMMTVLYAYGYVGLTLFYSSLFILLIYLKKESRYIALIYIGLTFSSDVVGFIWMIFLLGVPLAINKKE